MDEVVNLILNYEKIIQESSKNFEKEDKTNAPEYVHDEIDETELRKRKNICRRKN